MLLSRIDIPQSCKEMQDSLKVNLSDNADLQMKCIQYNNKKICLFYFRSLVDSAMMNRDLLPAITFRESEPVTVDHLLHKIPVAENRMAKDFKEIISLILAGWTYMQVDGTAKGLLVNTYKRAARSVDTPKVEDQILGPRIAYTESIQSNINLLTAYLPSPSLVQESLNIGKRTNTQVAVFYLKDLVKQEDVELIKRKIQDVDFEAVIDSAMLVQWIEDNSMSLFPQMLMTERVDRTVFALLQGKMVLFVGGSSFAIITPVTFIDFFKSTEDHYTRWERTTFIRLLRVTALFMSLMFTAFYVAALTFHYEVIPQALVVSLSRSRTQVPFPPLFEALFLEYIIELLAEAGARLPTKIGQTIGIVGGIVIGQAAVQAGFTSNILIIIVALSALSSYTTPVYNMSTSIRILRFPMILLAGTLGFLGITAGMAFLLIHLIRQTSLKKSYLFPFYPLKPSKVKDTIFRMPFAFFGIRSPLIQNEDLWHMTNRKKEGKDIDED